MDIKKHWPIFILIFIILFFFFVQLISMNDKLSDAGDNGLYIILAKSLSQFTGYREINEPDMPVHVGNPPMFPVMLVPIVFTFGINITALKIYNLIISAASLFAIYLFFKEIIDVKIALAITFLTSISYEYLVWAQDVMPESAFMLFTFMALYFLVKDEGWWMILFTLFSIFTKPVGLMLLPAILIYLIFKKEYKAALITFIVVGFLFGLWSYRNATYTSLNYVNSIFFIDPYNPGRGYLNLYYLTFRIGVNMYNYLFNLCQTIVQSAEKVRGYFYFSIPLIAVPIAVGYFKQLIDKKWLLPAYFTFFMGMMIIWPWQSIRFIVPLIPIIYLFFIEGTIFFFSSVTSMFKFDMKWLVYGSIILLILIHLPSFFERNELNKNYDYDASTKKFYTMAEWSKTNLNQSDYVLNRKPYLFYIWSGGVKSTIFPYTTDAAVWMPYLIRANYLIYDEISQTSQQYITPIIDQFPFMFKPLFYIERTAVFEILGSTPEEGVNMFTNETGEIYG